MEIKDKIGSILNYKNNDLFTASPDDTVFQAIEKMSDKNVGALPVVDQNGRLIGIVSERDYTRKVILNGKSSQTTRVKQIMTSNLVTAKPRDSVEKAMHTMTEKKVRHLPILDENKMVGIVTIGDLVKWTISAQGAMIDQLEGYIRGSYPA